MIKVTMEKVVLTKKPEKNPNHDFYTGSFAENQSNKVNGEYVKITLFKNFTFWRPKVSEKNDEKRNAEIVEMQKVYDLFFSQADKGSWVNMTGVVKASKWTDKDGVEHVDENYLIFSAEITDSPAKKEDNETSDEE